MKKVLYFIVLFFLISCNTKAQILLGESFDNVSALSASGWVEVNRSSPVGLMGYFQGNPTVFSSFQGAPNAYLGVNYNSVSGINTISNWMMTPQVTLENGDSVKFWTRSIGSAYPDRLQLRLNSTGSTNVGSTALTVGDFTVLLLDINPTLVQGGYPSVWTQYSAVIGGLSGPTVCRLAFRYFVTDGGPLGSNSDYIGIDEFSIKRSIPSYSCSNGVGCQFPDLISGFYSSPNSGYIISDQFVPTTSSPVSSVCWYGGYWNPMTLLDCGPGPGDDFRITYYNDDAGQPGTVLAGPFILSAVSKVATSNTNLFGMFLQEWGYEAVHPPVSLIAHQRYWIEITNHILTGDCYWFWEGAMPGDHVHYVSGFGFDTDDLAFCLDVPIKNDGGLSAAPVNDVCQNAFEVFCGDVINASTVDATAQLPPPYCQTSVNTASGIWFKFNGTGQRIEISTCAAATDYDTKITVYAGNCTNLTCVAGNDDMGVGCSFNSLHSEVDFCTEPGVEYYIYVTGYGSSAGDFQLQVNCILSDPPSVINCPAHITQQTDAGSCSAFVSVPLPVYGVDFMDDCSAVFYNDFTLNDDASALYPFGSTNLLWTAEDNDGQTATCVQVITIVDQELPAISCPPNVSIFTDPGLCSASGVFIGNPVVSDNCGISGIVNDAVQPFYLGATLVTWTVTDNSNNISTCQQTVTVSDNIPPQITCPVDITINVDPGVCFVSGVALGTPATSDNCNILSVVNDAVQPFYSGLTSVIWTVTDHSSNSSTCTQIVTVVDNIPPQITCPPDVTVGTDVSSCAASGVALGTPVTSDNCGVFSIVNDAVQPFALGTSIVTWTVTDNSNHSSTCQQMVTVSDNIPPLITCPSDIHVNVNQGACHASGVILGLPSTSDNCGVFSVVNDAVQPFPLGTTLVTWTVADNSSNGSSCQHTVTVFDDIPPLITCPPDITVNVDSGSCFASVVALGTPVASDNCSVLSVVNDAVQPFLIGSTMVIWTVTDNNSNTSTCMQSVTVIDDVFPQITCPQDITVITDTGYCFASGVALGIPVTSDNCGIFSVVNDVSEPFGLGPTTITWTATDNSSNSVTCIQTITVVDSIFPQIYCPPDLILLTDSGSCIASGVVLGMPLISDNCGIFSLMNDAMEPYDIGTTTITWTVADSSNNISTCTHVVIVEDHELPLIVCPPDTVVPSDPGLTYAANVVLDPPFVSDNCALQSFQHDGVEPYAIGNHVITWTVTDQSNNSASCIQNMTVTPFVSSAHEETVGYFLKNQPNPFENSTEIIFGLASASVVSVKIFDIPGKLISEIVQGEELPAGIHRYQFIASDYLLTPGIYFAELKTEKIRIVRKIILN
jgi:hypothetical protein